MPIKHKDVGTTLTYDEYHAVDGHEPATITNADISPTAAIAESKLALNYPTHARLHDHSLAADGSPIAVAGVPDLPATKVTSLRFALARLPDGTSGYFLKGQGAGLDPIYALLTAGDIPALPASKITSERFVLARMPDGTLNYVLKGSGAGLDPVYGQVAHTELTGVTADQHHARLHDHSLAADGTPIAVAGVPNLPASKITSGILAAAIGGLAKALSPTWTNDYILVYKTATDNFVMESKPTGADHNILSATHLDTLAASVVAGDIIIGNATPKWARLAKGVDGQFLKLISGLPAWADPPGAADHNLLSTTHPDTLAGTVVRGDIIVGNATPKWARLAFTANQVLKSGATDPAWGLILNADVDAAAAIAYSKLALTGSIVNADIAATAAIAYSKLALTGSIVNADIAAAAAILESKLSLNYPTHAQLHKDAHKSGGGDAFASTDLLEAVVKRLQEATPTTLTLGSIADGEFLKRSGTTIIGGAAGGAPDPEDYIDLIDDFIAGSTESGEIGELGWILTGTGTVSVVTAEANHPGIYRKTTGSASGNSLAFHLYNAMTGLPLLFGMSLEVTFIVRFQQSTALLYKVGLSQNMGATANEPQALFEFDPVYGPDTYIMCVTASGTGKTRTSSGVLFAVDTWYKLKVKRNANGNWEFYINDTLVVTSTTNLPPDSSGTNVGDFVKTTEAVAKSMDEDFCRIKATVTR